MIRKYHNHKCRKPQGTAKKSHPTTTRHQGDKPSKATSPPPPPPLPIKMTEIPEQHRTTTEVCNSISANVVSLIKILSFARLSRNIERKKYSSLSSKWKIKGMKPETASSTHSIFASEQIGQFNLVH